MIITSYNYLCECMVRTFKSNMHGQQCDEALTDHRLSTGEQRGGGGRTSKRFTLLETFKHAMQSC